uniref:Uncharacterized protein n=1 Tax=Arundo donax TaxID=35708 RepID=A0A0A8XZN5_ARUDO
MVCPVRLICRSFNAETHTHQRSSRKLRRHLHRRAPTLSPTRFHSSVAKCPKFPVAPRLSLVCITGDDFKCRKRATQHKSKRTSSTSHSNPIQQPPPNPSGSRAQISTRIASHVGSP